jgi:hypothetical protein
MYSISAAIQHLNSHAHQASTGYCARYVRNAIVAGGIILPNADAEGFANILGDLLKSRGFMEVYGGQAASEHPIAGDVAVIQPYLSPKAHGHIAMFNGTMWVSDYFQPHGLYPNASYRRYHSPVRLFRPTMAARGPVI